MSSRRVIALVAILATLSIAFRTPETPLAKEHAESVALIQQDDIVEYVTYFAGPTLEGRDSPSRGLSLAARYIAKRLEELGVKPTKDSSKMFKRGKKGYRPWLEEEESTGKSKSGTFLRPWLKPYIAPVPKKCSLKLATPAEVFEYGKDFVPVAAADGSANGELVFCGYGIRAKSEKYDDLDGLRLNGKIAILFEGEPMTSRKFEGTRVSEHASLWTKVRTLDKHKVGGILVVRRDADVEEYSLGPAYRFTQAQFLGERQPDFPPRKMPPMLVISERVATTLLGTDAAELRQSIDESGEPSPLDLEGRKVSMKVKTELMDTAHDNVVGYIRGSDPKLANEYVVIGAHYDHIGAGPRARTGFGADDNASGTSALLEVIEALAKNPPRRSILCAFFSAEEDGLLGSKAFCKELPVDRKKIVAMLNLDMIGRGPANKVAVLGLKQNPTLKDVVDRANALSPTGVTDIEVCRDDSLFQRSDHYSFHDRLRIPTVFYLENYPVEENPDYHSWRDTIDRVNMEKITNTAKLAFNTVWLLANDDKRPPAAK